MKERVKSIDVIRTIAILAVIAVHTTTRTLEASKYNLIGFPLTIFLNQVARFAVPLFFVISGFVLEISWDKKLNYFSFIKKRLSRIFIPYIFWSTFYYLIVYNQNRDNFIQVILKGDASYQLYFIPTLCIFYLAFPLLHKIYNFISNKWVLIFLVVSQIWLLYCDYFIKPFLEADPIHIAILSYLFFIIGIVAAHNVGRIKSFIRRYIIFPGTILSGLYVFWEGRERFIATGNYLNFYSQWRPSVLIYTILISLTLFFIFEKKIQCNFFQKLSKLSFFVFFIHVAILESFWSLIGEKLFYLMTPNYFGRIIFDPIFFIVVASVSFLIAFIIHRISKLNKITG